MAWCEQCIAAAHRQRRIIVIDSRPGQPSKHARHRARSCNQYVQYHHRSQLSQIKVITALKVNSISSLRLWKAPIKILSKSLHSWWDFSSAWTGAWAFQSKMIWWPACAVGRVIVTHGTRCTRRVIAAQIISRPPSRNPLRHSVRTDLILKIETTEPY